jgi:hypothetical protein
VTAIKESEPREIGFGLPPERDLEFTIRRNGVMEYWSHGVLGKTFPGIFGWPK